MVVVQCYICSCAFFNSPVVLPCCRRHSVWDQAPAERDDNIAAPRSYSCDRAKAETAAAAARSGRSTKAPGCTSVSIVSHAMHQAHAESPNLWPHLPLHTSSLHSSSADVKTGAASVPAGAQLRVLLRRKGPPDLCSCSAVTTAAARPHNVDTGMFTGIAKVLA